MIFTDDELKRYDRHLKLADFGLEKQTKLKQSKVLIVGAGGLGCPSALYLAAVGIGTIVVVDDDKIELSNLQRQVAFSVDEIGQFKATALTRRLRELNPSIEAIDVVTRIDSNNIEQLIADCDLVIDGTDNFASRFLIADSSYKQKISYLHASIYQYQGQISLFVPGKTACFRCLFRQPPNETVLMPCSDAGILGVVTGSIGLLAATEAVKYLTDLGESIAGKVLIYNALSQDLKKFHIEPDINCPLCNEKNATNKIPQAAVTGQVKTNCLQRIETDEQVITVARALELAKNKDDQKQGLFWLDVREQKEYEQGHLKDANLWPLSILRAMEPAVIKAELKTRLGLLNNGSSKDQIIICYCQRGTRSLKAAGILREAGMANVFSLAGGIESWQANQEMTYQ